MGAVEMALALLMVALVSGGIGSSIGWSRGYRERRSGDE